MIPTHYPPNQQDSLTYNGHHIDVMVQFDGEGEPLNHYCSEGRIELSLAMIRRRLDELDEQEARNEHE